MKKILFFTLIILLSNSCSLKLKNLPIPNGSYKIGTDTFIFEDKSRLEWFTEDNENDFRRIAVQMWYPASEISDSLHPYIDNDIKQYHSYYLFFSQINWIERRSIAPSHQSCVILQNYSRYSQNFLHYPLRYLQHLRPLRLHLLILEQMALKHLL